MADKKKILAVGDRWYTKMLLELWEDKVGLKFSYENNVKDAIHELDSDKYKGMFTYGLWIQKGDFKIDTDLPIDHPDYRYTGGLTIVEYARKIKDLPVLVHQIAEDRHILNKAGSLGARIMKFGIGSERENLYDVLREVFANEK